MATNASTLSEPTASAGFWNWFGQFLKSELTPYPGRGVTVARMVIAATVTMILIMTFKVPGGAVGALYAFLISRDSLYATLQSAWTIAVSYTAGLAFLLIGATLFADQPLGRLTWLAGSLFVVFFVLRTLQNFGAATGFAILIVNALPIWHTPGSAEFHLETTLWLTLSAAIGAAVTVTIEVIFRAFHAKNEIIEGLDNRWIAINRLLSCYAENRPIPAAVVTELTQYAMIGVSGLRRMLVRSVYERQYREQMAAVVGLTGRLSDLGSTMAAIPYQLMPGDAQRVSGVVRQVDEIRRAINAKQPPPTHELPLSAAAGVPLLAEVERTVVLIPRVFSGTEPVGAYIPSVLGDGTSTAFFVRDAFSNNEHIKFALRGCLAATLCYFIYSILDWNGLSTSVTTCVLTALTNIGSSRQKQLLRFAGTAAGGIIFGIGAQVFILPEMDSIAQFTLLFAAVTAVGAWFATASPRLSYFGIQLALAFYLINLQEFTIQTSLAIARDRVVGVFLGLFVMWLVFDQIWAKPAAEEMITMFTANVRLIADLSGRSTAGDPATYIKWIRALRTSIYNNFQSVNAQADAIPFEFGPRRKLHMVARAHIRRWQPELRTLYLLQVASLHHRIFGAGTDFPKPLLDAQDNFHQGCARALDLMADRLEGKHSTQSAEDVDAALRNLEENLAEAANATSGDVFARAEGLVTLSRQIRPLLEDLFHDVNRTPSAVFVKM